VEPVGSEFILDGLVDLLACHDKGQDGIKDRQKYAVVPVPQLIDAVRVQGKGHWGCEQRPHEAEHDQRVAGEAVLHTKPFDLGRCRAQLVGSALGQAVVAAHSGGEHGGGQDALKYGG